MGAASVASSDILVRLFLVWWTQFVFPTPIGQCDPVEGPEVVFSDADRLEVYERVRAYSKARGDSQTAQAFFLAVAQRESHGRASVRHTRGDGENGLGPLGLNRRSHRAKWPGAWEDVCTPEVSVEIAHAIAWLAVDKYRARTFLEVQAIYSGRWVKTDKGWRADPSDRTVRLICPRMRKLGKSCDTLISGRDLGARVALGDRPAFVAAHMLQADLGGPFAYLFGPGW